MQKQLPARGANQLLTQVGTVVAYGCVALPLVTVGHLGSQGMSPDALFNVVGESLPPLCRLCPSARAAAACVVQSRLCALNLPPSPSFVWHRSYGDAHAVHCIGTCATSLGKQRAAVVVFVM